MLLDNDPNQLWFCVSYLTISCFITLILKVWCTHHQEKSQGIKKKLFMFSRFWERWDGIHFVYCQLWKYLGSFSSADKLELIRCKPGILGEKFKNGWTRKSRNRRDEKHSLGKERDQNPSYGIRPFGGPPSPLGKLSIVKKRFFVK